MRGARPRAEPAAAAAAAADAPRETSEVVPADPAGPLKTADPADGAPRDDGPQRRAARRRRRRVGRGALAHGARRARGVPDAPLDAARAARADRVRARRFAARRDEALPLHAPARPAAPARPRRDAPAPVALTPDAEAPARPPASPSFAALRPGPRRRRSSRRPRPTCTATTRRHGLRSPRGSSSTRTPRWTCRRRATRRPRASRPTSASRRPGASARPVSPQTPGRVPRTPGSSTTIPSMRLSAPPPLPTSASRRPGASRPSRRRPSSSGRRRRRRSGRTAPRRWRGARARRAQVLGEHGGRQRGPASARNRPSTIDERGPRQRRSRTPAPSRWRPRERARDQPQLAAAAADTHENKNKQKSKRQPPDRDLRVLGARRHTIRGPIKQSSRHGRVLGPPYRSHRDGVSKTWPRRGARGSPSPRSLLPFRPPSMQAGRRPGADPIHSRRTSHLEGPVGLQQPGLDAKRLRCCFDAAREEQRAFLIDIQCHVRRTK